MSLDLGPALRAALANAPGIGDLIDQWEGEPAISTRRPFPDSFPALAIGINAFVAITDNDGLSRDRPSVMADIAVYGNNPDHFRMVEGVALAVRQLFHRQKWAISPGGYDVVSIVAKGPFPGPTDDDSSVARIVGLTIQLRRQ